MMVVIDRQLEMINEYLDIMLWRILEKNEFIIFIITNVLLLMLIKYKKR